MLSNIRFASYGWTGLTPPSYIFSNRKFRGVILDPPDFNPGSWIGASSAIIDYDSEEFWLTARPRKHPPLRGYEVQICKSHDGENYRSVTSITKEDLKNMSGVNVASIEAQQLIRDPETSRYYLYVSVHIQGRKTDGGWDTFLLISDDPAGPWSFHGLSWKRGDSYDRYQARDATIGIVDGKYFALYKASSEPNGRTNVALATSINGIEWRKHGVLKVDGTEQPRYLQFYGGIFASSMGPLFIGLARRYVIEGCGIARDFEAYVIDYRNMNLEPIFKKEWRPLSPYERPDYPTHGYMNLLYDPFKDRILLYVEAIDPKYTEKIGWRTQVDRLIMYEAKLKSK